MLNLIRSLPYLLVLSALGYGYHYFTVTKLEAKILEQDISLVSCEHTNDMLMYADEQQKDTIASLEKDLEDQRVAITELNTRVSDIKKERDNYLSIFRRHDLTKLSIAKPGLIEPRINNGTKEVFEDIEKQTEVTQEIKNENSDDFVPFTYSNPALDGMQ